MESGKNRAIDGRYSIALLQLLDAVIAVNREPRRACAVMTAFRIFIDRKLNDA